MMAAVIAMMPAMFADLVVMFGDVEVTIVVVTLVVVRMVILGTTVTADTSYKGSSDDNSNASSHWGDSSSDVCSSCSGNFDGDSCSILVLLEH